MKREEYESARAKAIALLEKAHIVLTEDEREHLEVADFGLGDLEHTGLQLVTYDEEYEPGDRIVPFPVSWTVKMKKKQKETQDILSYHTQAAGCSDKARAKASGGRQPIEECGRTGL